MARVHELAIGILLLGLVVPLAAEPLPPASERFAEPDGDEIPDFQRHITTLMGRQGCNGRACHGSFQGQGGFQLSLFGYDFKTDHAALMAGDDLPRVNTKDPDASLILSKPIDELEHGGGQRLVKDSWQYNLLRRWITAGAPPANEDAPAFVRLEVSPSDVLFTEAGQTATLSVVAYWADGGSETVTPLARFQTNDESVATVDEDGVITALGPGDTHIVVFYENGVHPIPVLMPVSGFAGDNYPEQPATTRVDELVLAKLKTLGILPSPQADDADFLRRVRIDMTGTLPTEDEVLAFLADQSPDKRSRKIDELLQSPEYAAWWATKLGDWTGNNLTAQGERNLQREASDQWFDWLNKRLADNTPYDEIVEGMVVSFSRQPDQSYREYLEESQAYLSGKASFADRDSMPHFWARQTVRPAKEKALSLAYAFLGVRLQCAECHKHPFDQWTQQDFEQFTAFFEPIRFSFSPDMREEIREIEAELGLDELMGNDKRRAADRMLREGKIVPLQELFLDGAVLRRAQRNRVNNPRLRGSRVITPRLLGGDEVVLVEYPDPRVAVMQWMRDPENPYFTRAIVNRVWANYFGVGIIDPADDLNLANPPSNAALLDWLSAEFVNNGYDLHWLHRTICNSDAYQRTWRTNETNQFDRRNFSRALLRRMPAEVAFDALMMVTSNDSEREAYRSDWTRRQIGRPSGYVGRRAQGADAYLLSVFGKPERLTNCDCERSDEPTLLQTVFLRNDAQMLNLLERRDGWLAQVAGTTQRQPAVNPAQRRLQQQIARGRERLREVRQNGNPQQLANIRRRMADLEAQLAALMAEQPEPAAAVPAAELQPDQLIERAYLRVLARQPDADERATAQGYLAAAASPAAGLQDLVWALMNTALAFQINRVDRRAVTRLNGFRPFARKYMLLASSRPWATPNTTNVQAAPCHKPTMNMVMKMFRMPRPSDPLLPPSGWYR